MSDTLSPQTQAWLDQDDARVAERIRRYGVSIELVGMGRCSHPGCNSSAVSTQPFGYTIGLFGIAHPELAVVGLGMVAASLVLNAAARVVLEGGRLMPDAEIDLPRYDRRILVEQIPNPGDIAFGANRHYWRPSAVSVPLLQLTYSDPRGRFPSDPSYSDSRRRQPRPGDWDARSA